jgi:uncharacterized protein YbaR (Trm112 family)
MSMPAGTTRFRSTDEEEDDAVIQMAYARTRLKKMKGTIYLVCVVVGLILGVVLPFAVGGSIEPFIFPIWPLLFMPLILGIAGLVAGLLINHKIVAMSSNEMERGNDIKRFSNGALAVLMVAIIFVGFFGSLVVTTPSWLESIVDKNIGEYTKPVMGKQAQDFQFTPNDPLYITHAEVRVTMTSNNTTCDYFIGQMGIFDKVNDTENLSAVEGASLPKAYKYNSTKFYYDGADFKASKSYILRVYNYGSDDDIFVKIQIHRAVSPIVIYGMLVLCVCFAAVGGAAFGLMQALRVTKARPAAPAQPQRGPQPRTAAQMFQGMEEEVNTMFPARPAGQQPQRPAYPQRGPPQGPRPTRPPVVDGEVVVRPGVPSREIALERGPVGVQKSIVCPRCRTKFNYTKIEGQVTEIACPKCGKKGRVGAKSAPPTPSPTEELIAPPAAPRLTGRPPARPGVPPRPTRPPVAAKPAVSPLDDVLGTPAPAAPKPGGAKTKTIACPKCKQRFTVVEKPRPFDIKCPNCGKTGTLR